MNNTDRNKRKLERQKARREWKLIKPRPLNDLLTNGTGLLKWLILGGGLLYLLAKGGGLATFFNTP